MSISIGSRNIRWWLLALWGLWSLGIPGDLAMTAAWAQSPPPADAQDSPSNTPDPSMDTEAEVPAPAGTLASGRADSPWSAGVSAKARNAARALFDDANKLADKQLYASAAVKYKEALAEWDHPGIHYNLALVQLELDQSVAAYQSLKQAVRDGPEPLGEAVSEEGEADDADGVRKYQDALQQLELLSGHLVRVEIVCDERGAVVSLNGRELFVGPGRHEAVMEPGAYQLAARKDGMVADIRQEVFPAGQEVRYELILRQWVNERRFSTRWPWVAVGTGAVAMVAGGWMSWRATDEFGRFDQELAMRCGDNEPCRSTDGLEEMRQGAQRWRLRAMAGYAAGGALLVGSAWLFYWNREQPRLRAAGGASEGSGDSGVSRAVSVIPAIAPGIWGVNAELRF